METINFRIIGVVFQERPAPIAPNATNLLIPYFFIAFKALDADLDIKSLGAGSGAQGLSDFLETLRVLITASHPIIAFSTVS